MADGDGPRDKDEMVYIDHPVDSVRLAFLVGLVALLLPMVVHFAAANFDSVCKVDSVSHYYYAPVIGDILVGALFFIGAFMLVYNGDKAKGWEVCATRLTAVAAFLIALIPTNGSGCVELTMVSRNYTYFGSGTVDYPEQFDLFPSATVIHGLAAAAVFVFLGYVSLFVFTRVDDETQRKGGTSSRATCVKLVRNAFYIICGLVIWAGTLAMIAKGLGVRYSEFSEARWTENNVTFWIEAAILSAFGISWMVKGRFNRTCLMDEKDKIETTAAIGRSKQT